MSDQSSETSRPTESDAPAAVIVLAAGEGTRMRSRTMKVLHRIGGRTLVGHAIAAARATHTQHLSVVVRNSRDQVVDHVHAFDPDVLIADQDEIKGTGRAAECGLNALPAELSGTVLITYGDVPLLTSQTLLDLTARHNAAGAAVTVVTARIPDPSGYGRILRDDNGQVIGIMEQKDAIAQGRDDVLAIDEINSGIFAFDAAILREALAQITTDNAQGEKYLTDVIAVARERGLPVEAHMIDDLWQTEGVNTRVQLAALGRELNRRICKKWMLEGVTIIDPASTWIDTDVTIGQDTVIAPNTQLLGATTIGEDAHIGPEVTLVDCEVGDSAEIIRATAHLALIGPEATVGPYSYLRPGTELGAKGKIGGFVETKNAKIGEGAKVPHLTYCGDAVIGAGANIGAGTIFANYDGVGKHQTTIGAHSFVGSNSVLIAPVSVGDGAYVAAGSALTDEVLPGQIAIARGRQVNKDGWVAAHRAGTASAEAAAAAGSPAYADEEPATSPETHPANTPTMEGDAQA